MSTPLPPPPPPSAGPLPPAAPASTPEPIRGAKSRTVLILGAIVVLGALLGFGAVKLLSKDDAKSTASDPSLTATLNDSLSTTETLTAIQDLVARAETGPDEARYLSECPSGDINELLTHSPASIQDVAVGRFEPQSFVYQTDGEGEPAVINCTLDSADFSTGVGIGIGEAAPPYREGLIDVLSDFTLTFNGEREFRGGTILQFCGVPVDAEGGSRAFCEADWFGPGMWVGTFVASADQSSADAEAWLVEILPDVLSNVPILGPIVTIEAD